MIAALRSALRRIGIESRAYRGDTRAAAAVELALTFPFFMLFVSMIMEFTMFYFATSGVEQGVFDYSRRLVEMNTKGKRSDHRRELGAEIAEFVGTAFIAKIRYEIGPATENADFTKKLSKSVLKDFVSDKSQPVYLRVVATRRTFTYDMFRPVWDIVSNPDNGGLFSDIDILVVIPWPQQDGAAS